MFFKIKRNPRKTTRQTLNTEQLEPKAMFSVSPVEPVVALDVGPVNQTGYEFQAKDYTIPCYTEFFKPTHNDGLRAHPGGAGIRAWPGGEGLRAHPGGEGSKFGDIPTESGLRAHPGGEGSKFGDIMGEVGGVFESPHGTYFESPHGTYIEGPHDPQLQREGFMNPLDQMGFTKTNRTDVWTNGSATSVSPNKDLNAMTSIVNHPASVIANLKSNPVLKNESANNYWANIGEPQTGYAEAVGLDSSTLENSSSDSYSEVEWTYFVGGGKGSGYAEAVGLGSSTVDDYQQSNSYSEVEWTYSEARQEVFARMVR